MASARQLRRLKRVEVDGLFGIYNHFIDLQLNNRVTLLHGPNGVGKTTVLKMIDALLTREFSYFRRVPFERLLLGFHDGAELELTKEGRDRDADCDVGKIRLTANGVNESTSIALTPSRAEATAAEYDFLQRMGEDAWIDRPDGERLTDSEVVRKYGFLGSSSYRPWPSTLTNEMRRGCAISLMQLTPTSLRRNDLCDRTTSQEGSSALLVPRCRESPECSTELKKKIDDTMAEYGRQAQTLDQTFLSAFCIVAPPATACPLKISARGWRTWTARRKS